MGLSISLKMYLLIKIGAIQESLNNQPNPQTNVQQPIILSREFIPSKALKATMSKIQQQEFNIVLSDEDKRTKYLLTCSQAPDCGDDYFVNIDTANEMYDSVKHADQQNSPNPDTQDKGKESFRAVNANLKMIHQNTFVQSLRLIDLQYNKIRTLPDEISSLVALTELKLDHNLICRLPDQFWRLKSLKEITLSHNLIYQLPENFHWLQALEVLKLDYNRFQCVPESIGLLVTLRKLHLHENRIAHLPREIYNLGNLIELSIEWFIYTKPSNSKIQKSAEVIKSVRDFCQGFKFQFTGQARKVYRPFLMQKQEHISNKDDNQSEDYLASQLSSHSSIRKRPINSSQGVSQPRNVLKPEHQDLGVKNLSRYVSFTDFLLHFHKVPHNDVGKLNELEFTIKKRSIVHHLCSNLHMHLLANLLGHLPKMIAYDDVSIASRQLGKVLNLNRRDIQGVSPACMLIMNFSLDQHLKPEQMDEDERVFDDSNLPVQDDIQAKAKTFHESKPLKRSVKKQMSPHQKYFNAKDQELVRIQDEVKVTTPREPDETDSSFVDSDDSDNTVVAIQQKRQKEKLLYLLLDARDEHSQQMVSLNDEILEVAEEHPFFVAHKPPRDDGLKSSVITVKEDVECKVDTITNFISSKRPREQPQQQHNILFWAVFKYRFDLAIDLIAKYGADCKIVNSNGASLLHILFANFEKDRVNAEKLSNLMINEHGLDVNLQDVDGKSALHVAIGKQQQRAIDYAFLHNYRARFDHFNQNTFDFELPERHGKTALHYAIKKTNYQAFIFILKNHIGDCFIRDFEAKTPRQNTFINTAFYRVLIREEKNYVARLIRNFYHEDSGNQRDGAVTRCVQENLDVFQKEFQSVMTAFDTVRSYRVTQYKNPKNCDETVLARYGPQTASPRKRRASASINLDQENANDITDDQISCSVMPINAPNISKAINIHLDQRRIELAPQIDGRYPTFQLGQQASSQKNHEVIKHSVMSIRVLPSTGVQSSFQNHPNQFDFTLGQPRLPQFFANDFQGKTDRNSEISLEILKQGSSFEMLLRQDVNRPVLKGPTEQVPQKAFDMGLSLAQQATESFINTKRVQNKSVDSWMVLSSNQLKQVEDGPIDEHYAGIKVEEVEQVSLPLPRRSQKDILPNSELIFQDSFQQENLIQKSPCFKQVNNTKQDRVETKEQVKPSNIFISNLSINVNYNININLSQGQQLDQDLAQKISQFKLMTRSPSKPQLEQKQIPSKIVPDAKQIRDESLDDVSKIKQQSFMTSAGEENVEASFRSILGLNGIIHKQPHQLLNKLSQPILDAVSSSHGKRANIFIDNMQFNGDESALKASPEPRKKLISGYGIEDTIQRRNDGSGRVFENNNQFKNLYQSCDIQADSIDCTHMLSSNKGMFSKLSQRDLFAQQRFGNNFTISENLESSVAGKTPCKPTQVAQQDDWDTLYQRNQVLPQTAKASFSDLCAEQRQAELKWQNQDNSFRDCNLSEISNSPKENDQRKQLVNEYQLAFREIPNFQKQSYTFTSVQSREAQAIFAYDETAQDEHQVTNQSLTCVSEARDAAELKQIKVFSKDQKNQIADSHLIQPLPSDDFYQGNQIKRDKKQDAELIRSLVQQHHNFKDELKLRNEASLEFEELEFVTIIKPGGPKVFQKSRSFASDQSPQEIQIQNVVASLKGNEFLPEFQTLVNRAVPEWQKFEVLFNRLAPVLSVCSNRVQSSKKLLKSVQVSASDDKRRKDALICLKVLADLLSSEQSALSSEVLHLISKHNIVKARSGVISSLSQTAESSSQIKVGYQLADEPTHQGVCCQSKLSSVSAVNHLQALHEARNAKAVNETYKKIQMYKFPTVSHKLGKFLKDKKDLGSEKIRNQSISSDRGHPKPRIQKLVGQSYGPVPIKKRHRVFTRESFLVSKRKTDPDLADQLITPKMTFTSEQELEKATEQPTKRKSELASLPKFGLQKSVLLASQMNKLNNASPHYKLKPAAK